MSIEVEIARLAEAKDGLATWLSSQGFEIQEDALLNDLVNLLDGTALGSDITRVATVTITSGIGVTLSSIRLFFKGEITTQTGTSLICPVGSLMIIAVQTTGGNTQTNASPTISVTGDLTTQTAYLYASNSTSLKGVGVFLIAVNGAGSITLTRRTSTGAIM